MLTESRSFVLSCDTIRSGTWEGSSSNTGADRSGPAAMDNDYFNQLLGMAKETQSQKEATKSRSKFISTKVIFSCAVEVALVRFLYSLHR